MHITLSLLQLMQIVVAVLMHGQASTPGGHGYYRTVEYGVSYCSNKLVTCALCKQHWSSSMITEEVGYASTPNIFSRSPVYGT